MESVAPGALEEAGVAPGQQLLGISDPIRSSVVSRMEQNVLHMCVTGCARTLREERRESDVRPLPAGAVQASWAAAPLAVKPKPTALSCPPPRVQIWPVLENASLRQIREIIRMRRAGSLTLVLSATPLAAAAVASNSGATAAAGAAEAVASGEWADGAAGRGSSSSDGEVSLLDAVGE